MSKSKDILPENSKGEWYGYCERYWKNGQLMWKGVSVNNKWYGYVKYYWEDGSVVNRGTGYFLDNDKLSHVNEEGYCYTWNKELA